MNINRYINFERLLTLNYKKIGLSDDEFVLLCYDGVDRALYERSEEKQQYKPFKMFNLD